MRPVEEGHAAQDAILGPVANRIGDALGVLFVGSKVGVGEQSRPGRYADPETFWVRSELPACHCLDIRAVRRRRVMERFSTLKQVNGYLMDRDRC